MTENEKRPAPNTAVDQVERLFRAYDVPFGASTADISDKVDGYVLALKGFSVAAVKMAVDKFVSGAVERKKSKRSTLPTSDEFGAQVREAAIALKVRPADTPMELAPPFGPMWGVKLYELLLAGPDADMVKPSAFIAAVIAEGGERGESYRLHHQAASGFKRVNAMFGLAADGKGTWVEQDLAPLAKLTEPVPINGGMIDEWRVAHEGFGWPSLPNTGKQRVLYLPVGGPEALGDFERVLGVVVDARKPKHGK